MKLLIVEDNSGVRHVIRSLVATVANEIRECADGAEALAAYSANGQNFVGFVLMDIDMKTMEGITAMRHIMAADPSPYLLLPRISSSVQQSYFIQSRG